MFKKMIGSKLVDFKNNSFVVRKGNRTFSFVLLEENGDCCGFNDLISTLLISEEDLKRNPVITKIEEIDQCGEGSAHVVVTFFGEDRKLAQIDSLSSSGSGWSYGACVILKCLQTSEEEIITQW